MSVTWIEASAGTGKTYTLVQTVVSMIREGRAEAGSILLVTFTEKATAELKARIRSGIRDAWKATGDPALAQALEDLPSLTITTIHGFCRILLTQFPLESGVSFRPEMVDQGRRWRRLLRDRLRDRLADLDPGLLAWARLEDEEELLDLAGQALDRNLFSLPLLHPTEPEQAVFAGLRADLESGRGPLWDAAALLEGTALPEDSRLAFGEGTVERLLHAVIHRKPYQAVRQLARARTFRDLMPLLEDEVVESLGKWDEGSKLWKKAAVPPFTGTLETVRTAALAFTAAVEAARSALPGVGLGDFLHGAARHRLLADLCLPVLDQRSARELTFHDLIDRVRRLVTGPRGAGLAAGAAARWKAVLIDEFQDTDQEQWDIFSSLFLGQDHDLTLVGDPKQSIYRFRGADLAVYRAARDRVAALGARTLVLEENFRSTAPMVEAVNRLFDPAVAGWAHADDFRPSSKGAKPIAALVRRQGPDLVPLPPLAVFRAASDRDWHRHLVAQVLAFLDGGHFLDDGVSPPRPLTPGDFLVLVRKKREAWALHRVLTSRGIPAAVGGSGGLLGGREAQEVLLFLKALESPRSPSAARALGLTRPFAGATLDQLVPALDEAQGDHGSGAFLAAFRRVAAVLDPGVPDGGGLERLLALPGGPRTVTNLEHVLELVQERFHRGEVPPGQAALCLETWIQGKLQEDEVDLRREGEAPTLRLMTIHAAKGLEAPVVLHGWNAPGKPRRDPPWLVAGGADFLLTPDSRAADQGAEAAEALRLRYVAQTRARTHQVLLADQAPGFDAVDLVPLTPGDWARLVPWSVPEGSLPPVPALGAPVEGLETRHPWVESHSGLWRRATRDERPDRTTWDRPRGQRDLEGPGPLDPGPDPLPAGPVFGDLVHDILEEADFRGWAPSAPPELRTAAFESVQGHCQRHRADFQGRDLTKPLDAWLGRTLNQPFPLGPGTTPVVLTTLAPGDTRRELEFHLPFRHRRTATAGWGARTLVVHPGYLTGRIDLLFRWEGKLYLADWKTNRLAPGQESAEVMAEAGYDLQAQWYWEALKVLGRLQGETLEPGGVLYLFLRAAEDRAGGVFLSPDRLDGVGTLRPFLGEVPHG